MRRIALLLVAVAVAGCGGEEGERAAVARGNCLAAWNDANNPHRSAVPESMGVANVSKTRGGCAFLFHDWGRYVSYRGEWGDDRLDWQQEPVEQGEWTVGRQRPVLDDYVVAADGRLRSLAESSRSWGRRWCRPVGRSGGRVYELCREPLRPGAHTRWTNPGALVLQEGSARRVVHLEPPPGTADTSPMVGHWERALLSPDGHRLLLEWSAECEAQFTFLADAQGGQPWPALRAAGRWYEAPSSVVVGWESPTVAIVETGPGCSSDAEKRRVRVAVER